MENSMNTKKLALGAVMSVALGTTGGVATAAIPGILGEAGLVPAVLSGNPDGAPIHTYVGIYIPEAVGFDTITAQYTAPHAAAQSGAQVFEGTDAIYWTLFDKNSKKIEDGTCDASPGDIVLWSTDPAVQAQQRLQRQGLIQAGILGLPDGIPDPVCGPTNTGWRFGYLIIQTNEGASRRDADFAFSAYASVVESGVLGVAPQTVSMAAIPVLPMADGDDAAQPTIGFGNEVLNQADFGDGPGMPTEYAPIISGNRMNNADGDSADLIRVEAPIQGPAAGLGRSAHFFWFDRNNEDRYAYVTAWDDHEGFCTNGKAMPREMEIVVYNHQIAIPRLTGSNWGNLAASVTRVNQARTQLIDAVEPPLLTGYQSDLYCLPPYWNPILGTVYPGAISGNVDYEFLEEGEPAPAGRVNSAMISFHWQESTRYGGEAWAYHMSTGFGILDNN
jgi:hypothetical protein